MEAEGPRLREGHGLAGGESEGQWAHRRRAPSQPAGVHLHRVPQQMDLCAPRLPQHEPDPGALCGHLAGLVPLPEAEHLCPQASAAFQAPPPGPQLLWLRGLHEPFSAEQHHRHLPAGQGHDHAGDHSDPDPLLQENLFHQNTAHAGE